MADVDIRIQGRAGRITLSRPSALNALSYDMILAIDAALIAWRDDPAVALIVFDAVGEKAFCAGGDIAEMHASGMRGEFGYGQKFWRDEYRMNARLADYPKPVVSFMQGFTMGGGVGIGCHGSHRVVDENSIVAMPECTIGLIPDVGGSLLLARAPGRLGEYLAATSARLIGADAVYAGFADRVIARDTWHDLIAELCQSGTVECLAQAEKTNAHPALAALQPFVDRHFGAACVAEILLSLAQGQIDAPEVAFLAATQKAIARTSPLATGCAIAVVRRLRSPEVTIQAALAQEYRFTYRAMQHGEFLEGIRAAIIDKDRKPVWKHATAADVSEAEVNAMLAPLGKDELSFAKETT
jgi:enoyl-CoA hydratase